MSRGAQLRSNTWRARCCNAMGSCSGVCWRGKRIGCRRGVICCAFIAGSSTRRNPWWSFRSRVLRRAICAPRSDWASARNAASTTFRPMDFVVGRGSAELNRHPHARPKAGCFDRQSFDLPRRYSGCDFVGRQGGISHRFGCQEPVGG